MKRLMHDGVVEAHVGGLQFPLDAVFAGRLSAFRFKVAGVPEDAASLAVLVGRTAGEDGAARDPFSVAAAKGGDGLWSVYLSPWCFPDAAKGLHYSLVAETEGGDAMWLGTGALEVLDCPANGSGAAPEIVPKDCYAYNPTTKLYHKITASLDEDGNISLDVEADGVRL